MVNCSQNFSLPLDNAATNTCNGLCSPATSQTLFPANEVSRSLPPHTIACSTWDGEGLRPSSPKSCILPNDHLCHNYSHHPLETACQQFQTHHLLSPNPVSFPIFLPHRIFQRHLPYQPDPPHTPSLSPEPSIPHPRLKITSSGVALEFSTSNNNLRMERELNNTENTMCLP